MKDVSKDYLKLLLSEFRMVSEPDFDEELSEESLTKALTLNENLKSCRYILKPGDIVNFARKNIDGYYDDFLSLLSDVKSKPMYPDFPSQVMEMDEAVFRFHQACHYFSTYGFKAMTRLFPERGWLPPVPETEKTVSDIDLADKAVLEVVPNDVIYSKPFNKILNKNSRMTLPEIKIIEECLNHSEELDLERISVPFKENLTTIFNSVMESSMERDEKVKILHSLCQHTGDVWKCLKSYLDSHEKWHLKTSEKRTIVDLLESYSIYDFRSNLIITNKKAFEVTKMLEFLSYNQMSKSSDHKKAVYDLRQRNLRSWQSKMHELINSRDPGAIEYMAERPGVLLRNISWLLKAGFPKDAIKIEMENVADKLSMQSLIDITTYMSNFDNDPNFNGKNSTYALDVFDIAHNCLLLKMKHSNVPFRGKNVYIDWQNVRPEFSHVSKSDDRGYVRSGLALDLPQRSRYLRFFCYWDGGDNSRIDVDLHARRITEGGCPIHVGWNNEFNINGVCHSGDITHAPAAEYIDIDTLSDIDRVAVGLNVYYGPYFDRIDDVYTRIVAVSELRVDPDVELYNQKNVLWSHDLTSHVKAMEYATIDVKNNCLRLECNPKRYIGSCHDLRPWKSFPAYNLSGFMSNYLAMTGANQVDNPEKADIILKPYKAERENEMSILDNNYFIDYKPTDDDPYSLENEEEIIVPPPAEDDMEYDTMDLQQREWLKKLQQFVDPMIESEQEDESEYSDIEL